MQELVGGRLRAADIRGSCGRGGEGRWLPGVRAAGGPSVWEGGVRETGRV